MRRTTASTLPKQGFHFLFYAILSPMSRSPLGAAEATPSIDKRRRRARRSGLLSIRYPQPSPSNQRLR